MKVLIGGGTGFIGNHLRNMLSNKGYDVISVSRKAGNQCITWTDLYNKGLPSGCSAVVNLAGQNLMDPMKSWTPDFQDILHSSRIDTTKELVRVIQNTAEKPKVFISSSAVGIYPSSQTVSYTEQDKPPPTDFLSILTHNWEDAARLPEESGVRHATVRIGLVLGRDGGIIQNMFIPFFMGVGGPISTGKQWFPWIHVDDVAGIITHAIENDHVSGVLNAVAPEVATNAQFTKAFASALWRPAFIPLPTFVLNKIFGEERAKIMTEGQKVIPKRTLESGYKYLYPDLKSACTECSRLMPLNMRN